MSKRGIGISIKWVILVILLVMMTWGTSGWIIYHMSDNWGDRGTMGDMFGAVNSLFSGLAFAALLLTIFQQRQDIKLNRIAIEQNRKELAKAAVAQHNAQQTLKEQVVQLHLTARLNAMNTVIGYYHNRINDANASSELIEKAMQKRKAIIQQIDDLIDGLDDLEIE